jgi:DNA-directed RNA polymerase specialized sigma24 family protein
MEDNDLQKHLLTMGDSSASPEQVSRAWDASTIGDAGYASFVYKTAKSYAKGDWALCEDLVHEAYLKVREAAKRYRPRGSAHQWRKTVTLNAMKDAYRKKKRRDNIVRTIRFTPGSGIEDFLGDEPHFPPE